MLYLLLQRDLQKIDLARNHVISEPELSGALDMIQWVTVVAQFRMWDLRGKKVVIAHHHGLPGIRSDIQAAGSIT